MKQMPRAWTLALIVVLIIVFTALEFRPSMPWTPVYNAELTWPRASKAVAAYIDRSTAGPLKFNQERLSKSMPTHNAGTWIIVTHDFEPDSVSLARLCRSVRNGATLCLASRLFDADVRDSFAFSISMCFAYNFWDVGDSTHLPYEGSGDLVPNQRIGVDSIDGWQPIFENDNGVYAAVRPFGKGQVILTNMPDIFTNNALLYEGHDDVLTALLKRLPEGTVTWDQHYKPDGRDDAPLLGVLTAYPGLLFAYWVLVVFGMGTVIINMKRRQRAIPVLPAVMDSAVEFVNQIAMVFWNRRDHRAVARQMLRQFRLHLVRRYRLQSQQIAVSEASLVARYTDCDLYTITRLLQWSETIDHLTTMSEAELQQLHTDLEHFFSLSTP
jgi:hypothetical protein